jgi:aspartokinase
MKKIKLRGLKLLEGGAQVASSSPGDDNLLATGVCSPLALNKINLTFLAHSALNQSASCITAFCTEGSAGRAAASLVETHHGSNSTVSLHGGISILSIFPHEQRPQVPGVLLKALARKKITLQGLASSPSAMSSIVSTAETEAAIDTFFGAFTFPAYRSPSDWHAAYEGKEHLLKKIIASYQEEVIRIYDIVQQLDLGLWSLTVAQSDLGDLGAALITLGQSEIRMPFIIALPSLENRLSFSFCLPEAPEGKIGEVFSYHLGNTEPAHHSHVAELYIHGPHFGDRYGIAHALVKSLESKEVSLLALGCTVSSLSVIVGEQDLDPAVQALEASFQKSSA